MGDYMSNSGITRRIDELGRLVIPKEIRKNLKIKDNDQIEINIINEKIVLNKYEDLKKDNVIHLILLSYKKIVGSNIIFTSRDKIVDYALINKQKIDNIDLDNNLVNIIENRKEVLVNNSKIKLFNEGDDTYIVSPLIINGDLYGSLIINNNENIIFKYIKTFLENYLE